MKAITKIKISSLVVLLLTIQCAAEVSSATTASAIQIDNTVPEPGTLLAITALLILFKAVRK